MTRPSLRFDIEQISSLADSFTSLMADLVKPNATKKDLEIAARVLRLANGVGVSTSEWAPWIATLSGQNKHETNFLAVKEAE